jgi:hypothetical protein
MKKNALYYFYVSMVIILIGKRHKTVVRIKVLKRVCFHLHCQIRKLIRAETACVPLRDTSPTAVKSLGYYGGVYLAGQEKISVWSTK